MTIMQNKCTVSFNGAIIIFPLVSTRSLARSPSLPLATSLIAIAHYDGIRVKLEFIGEIDNSLFGSF